MESVNQQFRQLKENYERMTEGELAAIAERAYDLTEIAREALQVVIMEKGVDIPIKMDPLALPPEDENLVIFGWPRGAEAAGASMKILAAAGIPSFLNVEVLEGDLKRAHAALEDAFEYEDTEEEKDYAVLCPKCRSGAVVLEERDSSSTAPFHWHCDACGHQWSDEGIEQEVLPGQEEEGSGEEHS